MKRLVLEGITFLIPENGYQGVIPLFYWIPIGVYADCGDLIKVREVIQRHHLSNYLDVLR